MRHVRSVMDRFPLNVTDVPNFSSQMILERLQRQDICLWVKNVRFQNAQMDNISNGMQIKTSLVITLENARTVTLHAKSV